jgi:Tn3 transposase DDE domain
VRTHHARERSGGRTVGLASLYPDPPQRRSHGHGTDTHGTNEVNFALLHVFGYQFASRDRDLYEKVQTSLYGFKHPSQYADVLLKPIRHINTRLIVDEWENMQQPCSETSSVFIIRPVGRDGARYLVILMRTTRPVSPSPPLSPYVRLSPHTAAP